MKFIQILNRYTRKIAMIWGVVFLFELVSPMAAMALTAGPTAPEATSFEPVDTTDMVNPLTGSFTYNLPLLEVPGPEGGYPLSLSYHAGIRPDVEASWVGLGWTLNPGAINRNVAGVPDDYNEVSSMRRDYWKGGNRKEYGLNVGFASSVNVGLVFASDTYLGFGVGATIGYGIKMGTFSSGVDVGIGPYGGGFVKMGVSSGIQVADGLGLTSGINVSTNFQSINVGAGATLSASNGNLLSASMNSSSNKPSLSLMGATGSILNKNAGKISTSSSGFGLTIPLGVISVGVSFKNQRYWSDETVSVSSSGSLYAPILSEFAAPSEWDKGYDNYRLLPDNINIADDPEEFEMLGGTLPEYDNYSISGQGIGGQIRPYLFQRSLYLQNNEPAKSSGNTNRASSVIKQGVGFRFVNDFSNMFDQGIGDVTMQNGTPQARVTLPFDMAGNADNRIGNELPASKFIKYFTNNEIRNGEAKLKGFIDVGNETKGFNRLPNTTSIGLFNSSSAGSQIGGFMVTNESGVTYHYALPAYSYNEYSRNFKPKETGKFTEFFRSEAYAYTWLLTAVTGPDYVDRNNNGLVDDGDWGYWVAMDYGRWCRDYVWRTPAMGVDKDLDQDYAMFTSGSKELYYLNKIRTRTHTAIFEKEVRLDAKSNAWRAAHDYLLYSPFDESSIQSLRLNKIYLLNNSDAKKISESSGSKDAEHEFEYYSNVIDKYDVDAIGRSDLESNSIRVIDFGFSYDLAKNTPNSFNTNQPGYYFGKLTLESLKIRGKGGASLLPQTIFSYEEPENAEFDAKVVSNNQFTTYSSISMNVGTMVKGTGDKPIYYGMITSVTNGGNGKIYTVANGQGLGIEPIGMKLIKTKNPDYCKDCQDVWGFYKGDISMSLLDLNRDLAKRVTETSAKGTDAWNLRSISSPTGNKIELVYESNEFKNTVFERNISIPIRNPRPLTNDKTRFAIDLPLEISAFEEKYSPGSLIDGFFMGELYGLPWEPFYSNTGNPVCYYEGRDTGTTNGIIIRFTKEMSTFIAGNIRLPIDARVNYGGGSRIKIVSNKTANNTYYQTEYQYRINNSSTGVTSYLPYNMETGNFEGLSSDYKKGYKKLLNKDVENILKYAREIPGPGIMYEAVRTQNKVVLPNGDTQKEGYTENTYRVMERRMINRVILQDHNGGTGDIHAVNLRISDFTTNIGDLKSIKYFDAEGKLIKEISNQYLYDETVKDVPIGDYRDQYKKKLLDKFSLQGFVNERFAEVRYHNVKSYQNKSNVVMTAREQYPSVLISSMTKDYINGSSESKENLAFDFLNGQLTKVLTKDSYGNRFLLETGFAYNQYPQMGNKLVDINNKNMLTQIHSQVNYKVDGNNQKASVISGAKTIWSKDIDVLNPDGNIIAQNTNANGHVWRKQREEILEIPDQYGDSGLLPISQFSLSNNYWKLLNVYSLYNVYSKGLEDYDRNNIYSANRYGYNNSKIVASAKFAKFKEIAFSGAEDEVLGKAQPGEVNMGNGTVSSNAAHTGIKSLSVPSKGTGFTYSVPVSNLTIGRTYVASVWVKNVANTNFTLYYNIGSGDVASPITSTNSTKTSGDWTLVNLEVKVTGGTTLKIFAKNTGTATGLMDDFRFHPKNSSSVAYVYDSFSGELTHILDHLNLFTKFEYDAHGRLLRTYKEQFGVNPYKTNEYQINYGQTTNVFYNARISQVFTRNDCTNGEVGTKVIYEVEDGKYKSNISQADADAKAQQEINQKGQAYANQKGYCTQVMTDMTIRKYTGWEGDVARISFYKDNEVFPSYEIFPTNSTGDVVVKVPYGEFSRVRIDVNGSNTSYNGYLTLSHAGGKPCSEIGFTSKEINFYNVKIAFSKAIELTVAEYCL